MLLPRGRGGVLFVLDHDSTTRGVPAVGWVVRVEDVRSTLIARSINVPIASPMYLLHPKVCNLDGLQLIYP